MKTTERKILQVLGLALSTLLTACGGSSAPYYPPTTNAYGYGAGIGSCGVPTGVKDKTVVGSLQGGATLTLDIYTQPSGTIAAVGMINIPSVSSLYQMGYGSVPTGATATSFQQCISSNGAVGSIDRSSTYENIELGSRYGIPTYITGDSIEGTMYIEMQGQSPTTFTMARP